MLHLSCGRQTEVQAEHTRLTSVEALQLFNLLATEHGHHCLSQSLQRHQQSCFDVQPSRRHPGSVCGVRFTTFAIAVFSVRSATYAAFDAEAVPARSNTRSPSVPTSTTIVSPGENSPRSRRIAKGWTISF